MYLAHGVIPVKSETKVAHAFPVHVDYGVWFQNPDGMLYVCLDWVIHSKVVDDKYEADGVPIVVPVALGDLALAVSSFVKPLGE